jgi:hypothetical protein
MYVDLPNVYNNKFLIDLIEVAQTLLSSFDYVLTRWQIFYYINNTCWSLFLIYF